MEKHKISEFKKGWLIGDFEPSIIRNKKFEFGVKFYKREEKDQTHFHKNSEEITVITSGLFDMNGSKLSPGDIVHVKKNEIISFSCIDDGSIAVIKTPSVIGDKFTIN